MSEKFLVNEQNFEAEVIKSKFPTLVDFFTPNCGPCKSVAVILDKFEKIMEGRIKVVGVDAEACLELAKRLGVRGVPTLMLFFEGKRVDTRSGILLPPQLRDWVISSLPAEIFD